MALPRTSSRESMDAVISHRVMMAVISTLRHSLVQGTQILIYQLFMNSSPQISKGCTEQKHITKREKEVFTLCDHVFFVKDGVYKMASVVMPSALFKM